MKESRHMLFMSTFLLFANLSAEMVRNALFIRNIALKSIITAPIQPNTALFAGLTAPISHRTAPNQPDIALLLQF